MTKGDLANRVVGFFGPGHMTMVANSLVDVLWPHIEEALENEYQRGCEDGQEQGYWIYGWRCE